MSLEPNPNSVFEKQGVQFKIITEDMFQDVKDFMHTHFLPDEPVMRSMKVTRNWFTDNLWLQDCLKHKTSIAAVDEQGALLAVHLGQVQRRNDYGKWIFEKAILFVLKQKWLGELLKSEGLKKMYVLMKLTNQVDFDVWKMFDKLNCEKIFENKGLCSARGHGIRGLGTELVKRADALALQLGCSHRYVICSGRMQISNSVLALTFF